jgi:hypothetical protein
MLVCPERKIIFFKPLKCAGTSVEAALYKDLPATGFCTGDGDIIDGSTTYETKSAALSSFHQHTWPKFLFASLDIKEKIKDEGYKLITIARNPFDVAVSYYWYLIFANRHNPSSQEIMITPDDSPADAQHKFEALMLGATMESDDPLLEMLELSGQKLCPLVYLSLVNAHFFDSCIDRFLLYENLQQDVNNLCDSLSIDYIELPHYKKYDRPVGFHFSEYHTSKTVQVIENYFRDVNDRLGYRCE